MCDVAFLLITFFMLTTTLQRPKTMDLFLPKDVDNPEEQNKVKESQALTILVGEKNKIYYYEGTGENVSKDPVNLLKPSTYDLQSGIGKVISDKWKSVIQNSGGRDSMIVIIKPTDSSSYNNVVTLLDDMNIYSVKKYALVDISDNDKKLIDIKEQGQPQANANAAQ
ncbi:biopolymer transporter ExbD [Compostibacter hankyongensis]|uniref:Biopolymer transporter ExbD n=2 Tax=Compostibacter hankyongensis TaxID=1007089 RepID=A0ABP8FUW5_9BACT